MFGDDPDPSVMTMQFGFGEVLDAREGSVRYAEEQGDRVQVWLGSERTTDGTGGTRTDASFENMMMQRT